MFAVAKAPLRISMFGGGTDLPSFYENHGGGVSFSFSIDKYMHVVVNRVQSHNNLRLAYSKIEEVSNIHDLEHDIVRNIWQDNQLSMGYEIGSFADLPTVGTGLGSSSAFTVAILKALSADPDLRREMMLGSNDQIAGVACRIEIDLCKSPIGKQDQYASAAGGLNVHAFLADGRVARQSYKPDPEFFNNLMLFYTGIRRNTNEVLSNQGTDPNTLISMRDLAVEAVNAYHSKKYSDIGMMLDETWQLKKSLGGVSNILINTYYERAIRAGALGGKLLGAGLGGYLLFYVPEMNQQDVRDALLPLTQTVFSVDEDGAVLLTKG